MKLVNLISMQTIARANEEVSNVREKERGMGCFYFPLSQGRTLWLK